MTCDNIDATFGSSSISSPTHTSRLQDIIVLSQKQYPSRRTQSRQLRSRHKPGFLTNRNFQRDVYNDGNNKLPPTKQNVTSRLKSKVKSFSKISIAKSRMHMRSKSSLVMYLQPK